MPIHRVVVELSPSRLRVALMRGSSVQEVRCERLKAEFSDNWPAVLDALRPQLTAMVRGLGATGAEATLLYGGPTATAGVFGCPQGQGSTAVIRAARLALAESAGFPLTTNPHDLTSLATDKPGAATDGTAQVHTLGVAEKESTAQALAEWLIACGLSPSRLVPIEVPAMSAAVERAMRIAGQSAVALVLYAGEHGSVLVAAADGQLRFVRQIALGTESLVEAISREVRGSAPDTPAVILDKEAAAAILFSVGIPRRDQMVDAARGLSGDAILPLLQPSLQRVVVELKQSLRFSLSEKERERARLYGVGPGTAVPRLLALIAEQSGIKLEGTEPAGAQDGNIGAWVSENAPEVNLLPRSLYGARMTTRLRRGLWVGVAAGLAVVAADAVAIRRELGQVNSTMSRLRQRLDAAKPSTDIQNRLIGAQAGIAAAREQMAVRLGNSASWDAVMVMLSQKTPEAIRLSQVQFLMDNDHPVCRLAGQAPLAEQSRASLQAYMDALTAVPIVKACKLGATQRGEGMGGVVQHFEMTLILVDLPASDPNFASIFGSAADDKEGAP